MTSPASAALAIDRRAITRSGFTLVEMLAVIGLIVVFIATLLGALRHVQLAAQKSRIKADIQAIAGALEAYAQDFRGTYPMTCDFNNNPIPSQHILAKALIGPGPAVNTNNPWLADGYGNPSDPTLPAPGFRAVPGGKVWPPYLQPEKFNVKLISQIAAARLASNNQDPVASALQALPDNYELLDLNDNPYLYLPLRRKGAPNVFPTISPTDGMYDPGDIQGYWDSSQVIAGPSLTALTQSIKQAVNDGKYTGPYILISAGQDGRFASSDDAYNFEH